MATLYKYSDTILAIDQARALLYVAGGDSELLAIDTHTNSTVARAPIPQEISDYGFVNIAISTVQASRGFSFINRASPPRARNRASV